MSDFKKMLLNADVLSVYEKSVNKLTTLCHGLSVHSGWWKGVDASDANVIGAKLCLVHSEVSEAMEGFRKDLMDDHLPERKMAEVEIADAIIRLLDLAGSQDFDIGGAIMEKLAYNQKRPDHKLENREKVGGKKF